MWYIMLPTRNDDVIIAERDRDAKGSACALGADGSGLDSCPVNVLFRSGVYL